MPESTPLDRESFEATGHPVPPIDKCLCQLRRPEDPATNRRFPCAQGSIALRPQMAAQLTPFFTERERKQAGVEHRLFFSQIEYCDNLIFSRRAAVDELSQRLLDANRTIGQPNKISVIFGHKVQKNHAGKLQTVIEDLDLPNPVIRSHYKNGFIKQYVRDDSNLRTEPATNNVTDYGVGKTLENLPELKGKLSATIDRYHDVQQDILDSFADRGQLQTLMQPTVLPNGKRIQALNSTIPDNWRWCMLWSASPILRLRTVLYRRRPWRHRRSAR